MKLTPKQIGEIRAREFLGEDEWIRMKQDLDALLSFRKTIKQKPDEAMRLQLDLNNAFITFYNKILFSHQ
jgi:hypothetical protein